MPKQAGTNGSLWCWWKPVVVWQASESWYRCSLPFPAAAHHTCQSFPSLFPPILTSSRTREYLTRDIVENEIFLSFDLLTIVVVLLFFVGMTGGARVVVVENSKSEV